MLRKPIGLIFQKLVEYELLKNGFVVSETIGDYSPYDLVCGWGGKLNKIQVKGSKSNSSKNKGFKISATTGSNHIKLTDSDCDFVICVIGQLNKIYVIPIQEIVFKSFRVHPDKKECRFLKYLEAWHLLK